MAATITYKGQTLTTAENQTRTLKTAGKYMEGDVVITDVTTGGTQVKEFGIRGDAELVQSYGADELLVEDLEIALPAYSTTAKTIVTGAALSITVPLDYANYNYYVEMRSLTIPIYDTETKQKGRADYTANSYHYEIVEVPASEIETVEGKVVSTSRSVAVNALGSAGREVYWTSATAVTFVTNSTYGPQSTGQAPTVSRGVLTVKAPNYSIRGSTTYMTSGAWGHMTDIRYQWKIEVWRAPKGNAADGWQHTQNIRRVFADVRNGGTLT